MAEVSYLDNNALLGKCYATRSYSFLRQNICRNKGDYTFAFEENGDLYGYDIVLNTPLTKQYGFPCWVVKFVFSRVDTLHHEHQENLMNKLVQHLKEEISVRKGYYNFRVPSHIVDLLKAVNGHLEQLFFCGGTVEEIHMGEAPALNLKDGMRLFFADESFVESNREALQHMAYKSFESYQGQYHISPVTDAQAGLIYSNWINQSLSDFCPNTILIAQYNGETVGYCTINENDFAVDAVLSSVNEERRGLGTYKAMITFLVRYAKKIGKLFVTSTQFDNYIVQGTWNSLGLRPFYSIYNFHWDHRV